ncbi:allantoinase [Candidatus Atribacteria bacterium RBG_19FT_COMBO_35_14]|uniref:allantoinase n=1 Tax=Candidatus Sediminicultor quintus TaxID=1797291 RepID=A0A1F5AFH4_9BACT|nr:MAG: allantoinase [Candidatus Atribacteria bacterium RBG_19FT_COMBO_35_14]
MLRIKNARIVEKDQLKTVNIYIERGKIKDILPAGEALLSVKKEIDAQRNVVFPGFIDPHVHFDDPGFTEREDFETGTKSAAAGGITTIIDMPCTSIPPITTASNYDYKLNIVKSKAYVDFAFWGGVTPEQVESGEYKKSLKELKDRGIVGVKFYTISGMELYPRMSVPYMDKVFRLMKELNLVCAIHAEDYYLVDYYSHLMQEMGREDPESWSLGRTYEAEPEAIWSVVGITEKVGNKLHIVHLSTKEGLNVIRWAKAQGLNVSTETCPQYLIFTTEDFKKLGSLLKIAPPLRKEEDREELWKGLKDGSIDFLSTDHAAGKYPEEKSSPDIWKNYAGIPGTQLAVPTMLHYGYHQGRLTLSEVQKLMSENTAKRYGLYPQKGAIQIGSDADFTIIDMDKEWTVEPSKLKSKGKYSPLAGKTLKGKIYMTILRGEIVYKDDEGVIGEKGFGELVKSKVE